MILAPLLGLVLLALSVDGHGSGAPVSQCDSMLPGHSGTAPQEGDAPYNISRELQQDNTIKVRLTGASPFKGFFIQAREADDHEVLVPGQFTVSDDTVIQTVNCEDKQSSAITHQDKSEKTEIVVTWTPPSGWNGEVVFRATVVQGYTTFWDGIYSPRLRVSGGGPSSPERETQAPLENRYSGCGRSFGCYGIPKGCLKKGSCAVLLTHKADREGVLYELSAPSTGADMWIAAGLSDTKTMEHAHVVECHLKGGQTSIRESWNGDGYQNTAVGRTSGVDYRKMEDADGMLICSWHRNHITKIKQRTFDTLKNNYHVLLAAGPLEAGTDRKQQHKHRGGTEAPVNLQQSDVSVSASDSDLFVKLHGKRLVIFFTELENVWESTMICGVKPWFAFHRGLMMLSVAMMIAALVLIFYRLGGWSPNENPHSILGIVSSVLGLTQPIMALFRCHPHQDHRYIFNWLHWFNGNAGQIIAVTAIFFATSLDRAQLKNADWFVYILAAFVGFHVLVHVVMQVHSMVMERKKKTSVDIKMQEITRNGNHVAHGDDVQPPAKDAPGGGFRRFMLGIYIVVALLVVAALVTTIWFAPS
ncbi:unnamed protein product [Ixodes hexagonus]